MKSLVDRFKGLEVVTNKLRATQIPDTYWEKEELIFKRIAEYSRLVEISHRMSHERFNKPFDI